MNKEKMCRYRSISDLLVALGYHDNQDSQMMVRGSIWDNNREFFTFDEIAGKSVSQFVDKHFSSGKLTPLDPALFVTNGGVGSAAYWLVSANEIVQPADEKFNWPKFSVQDLLDLLDAPLLKLARLDPVLIYGTPYEAELDDVIDFGKMVRLPEVDNDNDYSYTADCPVRFMDDVKVIFNDPVQRERNTIPVIDWAKKYRDE